MTAYEYYNLPDEYFHSATSLDEDLTDSALNVLKAAKHADLIVAEEVKIVHIYDRKGYMTADDFGGVRNKSYGSSNDDVVIQTTVRIKNPQSLDALLLLGNIVKERKTAKKYAALEEELAQLRKIKSEADAAVQKKIDEITEMTVQNS